MSAGRQLHNTIDHRSRQGHLAGGRVLLRSGRIDAACIEALLPALHRGLVFAGASLDLVGSDSAAITNTIRAGQTCF